MAASIASTVDIENGLDYTLGQISDQLRDVMENFGVENYTLTFKNSWDRGTSFELEMRNGLH